MTNNVRRIGDQLGDLLKQAMDEAGMTQAQLCREMGITQKHLSRLLSGQADGSLGMWEYAAFVLGKEWKVELASIE